jgi:hypothetical protein
MNGAAIYESRLSFCFPQQTDHNSIAIRQRNLCIDFAPKD